MKISTKGRYGLRAIVDLAIHSEDKPINLGSIAKRQGVSMNYLEQAFAIFKKAGFVKGTKGPTGGYQLNREPKSISVFEILEALEGELSIVEEKEKSTLMSQCVQQLVWQPIEDQINQLLNQLTLEDLIKDYYKQKDCEGLMFYI